MKITCAKTEFIQAVQTVAKAVATKTQTPILSGIYIKATGNSLEFQATNYEIGLVCSIEAEIKEEGTIVLPGRYLQEASRKLPGDTTSLNVENDAGVALLESNSIKFTLRGMPANEFPTIKKFAGDASFKMHNTTLAKLIRKTSYACSNDEARPIFTGCYFNANENDVTMAATNTHRLAVKKDSIDTSAGQLEAVIPAKVLNEIAHLIDSQSPADVLVTYSKNLISFEYENIYMSSRLIEGQYPDFTKVIPSSFATNVKMNKEVLSAAVDRVALISRLDEYNVMHFDFTANSVRITSNNPDVGNAEEIIEASIDGPDISISFNASYIMDVLKIIDSENISFSLNGPLKPVAVKEENDGTFLYIITPVRTS